MDFLDPWFTLIHNSGIAGFGVMTSLFSQNGQRWTNRDVDPTVREDLENPQIYGSHDFRTDKWIMIYRWGRSIFHG
jgi:hypothetical protein